MFLNDFIKLIDLNIKPIIMDSTDIENEDLLIITNEFLLDDAIALFGNLSQFDGAIERAYFSLESTPYGFQQEKITKEEFEKSPKYNLYFLNDDLEGYYSTLNYNEFSKAFDFSRWSYCFLDLTYIEEEFYASIREKLNTFQTDTQSKMFFQSLLEQLSYSDYFLVKFSQRKDCNKIQKQVCKHYIDFNKQIYKRLECEYDVVFSNILVKHNVFQENVKELINKKHNENVRYKIAALIADKSFHFDSTQQIIAYYKDQQFTNKSQLAEYFASVLHMKYKSLQPYVNQSLAEKILEKDNKSIFYKKNIEVLELIVKEKGIENCSQYFKDKFIALQDILK